MRELNDIPFGTDDDIRHTARVSMEHDITSHGGSLNNGDRLNSELIFNRYNPVASERAIAFEAFVEELLS